ncbi:sensor domain-containing diguanylate cyclase [Cohnella sp. GCM10027633]|uniref:sensor domain-containing diguanylate cyclase n=1 Tax=unclassified Cohnella TaxID=2636738 RepID=UPI0036271298
MRGQKGFTLRFAVNAIVLISVVVTLTISAIVGYRSEKSSLTRTTFQLNQVYVDKISDTVNGLFANMFDSLNEFGRYIAGDLKRPDLHERFDLFQRTHRSFNAVFVIDRDGYLVEGSNVAPKNIRSKIDTAGTVQALKERRPLISEPYVSKTTNKLIIMVSQPLYDAAGEYIGFIGGSIRLHETSIFQTILGNTTLQENGTYAYVTSESGVLLYHPDAGRIGEDVTNSPIIEAVKTRSSGQLRFVNSRDVKMLASYAYIETANWGIVSQTPNDTVLASARELVKKLVLYMLPALLVFIALIYWIVGKLASPFAALAQFASQLSPSQVNKDQLPRIHSWNYEANELSKAFGRAVRHFRYQFEHLTSEAQTDPLTGLYNRRTLDRFVTHHIEQQEPFSILLMDLDNFKKVNDTFGHDVGDEVLRFLASALKDMLGQDCVVCRMGGEEFVVLVPNGDIDAAAYDAEQVRAYMMDTTSPTGQSVTISIGVANYPVHAQAAEQLFRSADDALYEAKRGGRNRVVVASENRLEAKSG